MDSKKVIFWPVFISIIGHIALISASGMIDLRDNVKAAEIFTVDIKGMEPDKSVQEGDKKEEKNLPESKTNKESKNISTDGVREETVNLGSSDIKYVSYLVKIKRKILQIWEYPLKAYENNEEGVVVVKISLDAGALGIIKSAAPFEPLPNSYGLARLHIVASFRYKLEE